MVYGAVASTNLKRLDSVQAAVLRVCSGAFRTISASQVEIGEEPLWVRCMKLGLRYWAKLRGQAGVNQAAVLWQDWIGLEGFLWPR